MRAPPFWMLCLFGCAMFVSLWSGFRVLVWADRLPPRHHSLCPEKLCPPCRLD